MLKIGIIGLPNVGKSSLFNLITNSKAEEANYPFTTIEPNIGIVEIPDKRFDILEKIYKPKKIIKPLIKFWDIAGIVKGASEGVGLGNKFLFHIRETTILVHVLRLFEDKNILKDQEINALEDFKTINLELIFSDLELISKIKQKLNKFKKNSTKDELNFQINLCNKINDFLKEFKMLFFKKWTREEEKMIKEWGFLTFKKTLVLLNVSEDFLLFYEKNKKEKLIFKYLEKLNIPYVIVPIVFERLLVDFSIEEQKIYRKEKKILENTFNFFLNKVYDMLGLATFFTCGKEEVKGWTFKKGQNAPECAGIIHTDFKKGFIRCEILNIQKLLEFGSEKKVKEVGKLKSEGKTYIIKDGDICHFLFNI